MRVRAVLIFCLALSLCFGQAVKMTAAQLKSFLRSSIQLQHPDKRIADYLKNVKLTDRLTEDDVEALLGEGLGPKSAEILKSMVTATSTLAPPAPTSMPAAAPAAPTPPPSTAEQTRIITEAREIALSYTKRLPDFICLQVTRRYVDPSGLEFFHLADTVAARLSYFEEHENYKVISVNGSLSNVEYDKLGGATSSGEFGSLLREIFEPSTDTEFWWERWAKLRGRLVQVFGYSVKQANSKWHISWQRQLEIVPAYKGLIYIDRDVPVVMRVTMEAEDIPSTFPIQQAGTVLDYEYTDIAGKQFLLPLRAEVRMRDSKLLVKNVVEFRNYRKFGAETTITFDPDAEPISDEKLKENPPQPQQPPRPPK
jgi:hypothetical protein